MSRSLLCLSMLLLLPAGGAGAAQRPKVLVRFVAGGSLLSGLEDAARRDLGAHVAEQVREICAKSWRFVDWEAASGEPGASPPAWVWEVRAEEDTEVIALLSGQQSTVSRVRILHRVSAAAGTGTATELDTGQPTLYEFGAPKPSSALAIQQDLDRLIERQFSREFLDRVGTDFLKRVQLGDGIVVDAAGRRLIVPLRRCELYAGTRSQLEVRFHKDTTAGVLEGFLELEAVREVEQGSNAGCIYGPVLLLDFPPDRLTPNNYWDDRFPAILESIRDVRVYMLKYEADAANGGLTSGGVILDTCGGLQ